MYRAVDIDLHYPLRFGSCQVFWHGLLLRQRSLSAFRGLGGVYADQILASLENSEKMVKGKRLWGGHCDEEQAALGP